MAIGITNIDLGRKLQACKAEIANEFQHLTPISGVSCLNCVEDFEDGSSCSGRKGLYYVVI